MLINYLKITFRNFLNAPVYSLINIVGLSVGIACSTLIIVYLNYQFSFDDFHTHGERIFRLNKLVTSEGGGAEHHAITSGPMGPQILQDFPEVEQAVRVLPWFDSVLLSGDETRLKVDRFVLVDAGFFELFDFQLLSGDASTALVRPLSVVLSEQSAEALFGATDPVGQIIKGLNDLDYTVTGVVENAPDNSHLHYDALVSWSSTNAAALNQDWLNRWLPQAVYTYLRLNSAGNRTALETQLQDFMQRHFSERAAEYQLYLQPLSAVYLRSSEMQYDDTVRTGSITNVYIFSVVAGLVLLIACINYMNLSTARSLSRAREVGVRKVLGAMASQLRWQFLGESVLLSLVSMLLSLVLMEVGFYFLRGFGIPDEVLSIGAHSWLLALLLGITVATGLLAGTYPALVLSAFQPVNILRGRERGSWSGDSLIRKTLVILQFTLSIALIIGTLVISRQMGFINDKDLGFDKEDVLVLQLGGSQITDQVAAFREELLRHPNILRIAHSNSVPGSGFMSMGIIPEGMNAEEARVSNILRVGDDNLPGTYGIRLVAGRYFSDQFASDSDAVVINEAMSRNLGWQDPVGRTIQVPGEVSDGIVIGVIGDFHTQSLHNAVEPLLLYQDAGGSFLSLKISPANVDETLAYAGQVWERFDPDFPLEYFFLDERFAEFYSLEQNTLQIMLVFTGLAVFVSCLGLSGLSMFMAQQRGGEIGIRKILGSTVAGIVTMMTSDFLKPVGVGYLLALLPAWWLASRWLQGFSYRIELGVGIFIIAGISTLLFALAAVLWQSILVANKNPVESLRSGF